MPHPLFGWIEICLLSVAALLLATRALPFWRSYRPLFGGAGAMILITALFPRTGNPLGDFLFGASGGGPRLPRELFGIVWWILAAWLSKSLLDLVLRRTLFPDNDQPHARRLFADLASGLIYILAFVGIVGTVFKQPVSSFLAGSGVLAIVLGLALQNTLGDVLAGLAINIERPFGAGDWITLADQMSGQVMQVNWRATRLRTWSHDMVVIPNSIVSKAIVTNHTRPKGPHRCTVRLAVDLAVAPSVVIAALKAAAAGCPAVATGTTVQVYACGFSDSLMEYEVAFAIESFASTVPARSDMLDRIANGLRRAGIAIGAPAMAVRIIRPAKPQGRATSPAGMPSAPARAGAGSTPQVPIEEVAGP